MKSSIEIRTTWRTYLNLWYGLAVFSAKIPITIKTKVPKSSWRIQTSSAIYLKSRILKRCDFYFLVNNNIRNLVFLWKSSGSLNGSVNALSVHFKTIFILDFLFTIRFQKLHYFCFRDIVFLIFFTLWPDLLSSFIGLDIKCIVNLCLESSEDLWTANLIIIISFA